MIYFAQPIIMQLICMPHLLEFCDVHHIISMDNYYIAGHITDNTDSLTILCCEVSEALGSEKA